jgi:hypothetical protein
MFVPDTCETLVLASPLLSVDSSSGFPESEFGGDQANSESKLKPKELFQRLI